MKRNTTKNLRQVVLCNCRSNSLGFPSSVISKLKYTLTHGRVVVLNDLCGVFAEKPEEVQKLFGSSDSSLLLACYSRSIENLFSSRHCESLLDKTEVVSFRNLSEEEIINKITLYLSDVSTPFTIREMNHSDWESWYPVIDADRCNKCGQCVEFCLFGTYSLIENTPQVTNPKGCKLNCPACARICPQTAIIFPKYEEEGAIGGKQGIDDLHEAQQRREEREDILGGDVYAGLKARQLKHTIKQEQWQKAEKERQNALEEEPNEAVFRFDPTFKKS